MDRLTRPPQVHVSLEEYLTIAFGKVPVLGDLIEIITGVEDGDYSDLASWVNGIFGEVDVRSLLSSLFYLMADAIGNVIPGPIGDDAEAYIDRIAAGINTTASSAASAVVAASEANSLATAANSTASAASSTAGAAQTAASNAASLAAAAQAKADKAYANAQYDITEFGVSSAGVILGRNEERVGILMTKPTGWNRIITRVTYSLETNTGTLTVALKRKQLNGTITTILTTNISSAAVTFPDPSIDFTIADLDHIFCDVTAISGIANTLHCAVETVLVEE